MSADEHGASAESKSRRVASVHASVPEQKLLDIFAAAAREVGLNLQFASGSNPTIQIFVTNGDGAASQMGDNVHKSGKGDVNINRGNVVGAQGSAQGATGQVWWSSTGVRDATDIAGALDALRAAMRERRAQLQQAGQEDGSIDITIGNLAEASIALRAKEDERAQSCLRRLGDWVVRFARDVGVELAALTIALALGMK